MIHLIVHQCPVYGFVYANFFYAMAEYLPWKLVLLLVPFWLYGGTGRPHPVTEYPLVVNLFMSSSKLRISRISLTGFGWDSASGARPSCIGINIHVLRIPYRVYLGGL